MTLPVEGQPLCTFMASAVSLILKEFSIRSAVSRMVPLPTRIAKFKLITAMDLILTNLRCLQA
jgi:hypothetical protein